MVLKPQDVVVLVKAALWPGGSWKFVEFAQEVGMSASEVHKAIIRSAAAQLVSSLPDEQRRTVQRRNLLEFLVHGIRYVFPVERGALTRGIATGIAAPILQAHFGASPEPSVWPSAEGTTRGQSLKPLYPSVPFAASRDPKLYSALAVVDTLRGGRARERSVAADVMKSLISGEQ